MPQRKAHSLIRAERGLSIGCFSMELANAILAQQILT